MKNSKIWLGMAAVYLVWGSTYLGIRFVVETIPPFFSAALRFFIAAILLLTWRKLAGDPWPTKRQWMDAGIVGVLLLLGGNGFVSFAEKTIPSGIAALVVASMPLFLNIFEALTPGGKKLTGRVIIGLVAGFAGVYLLTLPSGSDVAALDRVGLIFLFLAEVLWALGSIYSKRADVPNSTTMWSGAQMLIGAASLFIVSLFTGELNGFQLASVSVQSWLGLLYLIVFGSLVAFVVYGWLMRNAPVHIVGTYPYVNTVVALGLGAWLGNETVSPLVMISAGIILASVLFINTSK